MVRPVWHFLLHLFLDLFHFSFFCLLTSNAFAYFILLWIWIFLLDPLFLSSFQHFVQLRHSPLPVPIFILASTMISFAICRFCWSCWYTFRLSMNKPWVLLMLSCSNLQILYPFVSSTNTRIDTSVKQNILKGDILFLLAVVEVPSVSLPFFLIICFHLVCFSFFSILLIPDRSCRTFPVVYTAYATLLISSTFSRNCSGTLAAFSMTFFLSYFSLWWDVFLPPIFHALLMLGFINFWTWLLYPLFLYCHRLIRVYHILLFFILFILF